MTHIHIFINLQKPTPVQEYATLRGFGKRNYYIIPVFWLQFLIYLTSSFKDDTDCNEHPLCIQRCSEQEYLFYVYGSVHR